MTYLQPPSNYRVSLKALIYDDTGRVLLVKESDDPWWGLPGGGLDHGETIEQGLRREIREELEVEIAEFNAQPTFLWTFYHSPGSGHILWLVHEATLAGKPQAGQDANEIKYVMPSEITPLYMPPYFTSLEELASHTPQWSAERNQL